MIASMGPSFQPTLTAVLKNPQVGHKVRVQDFDGWSGEAGTTRHYTMRYDHAGTTRHYTMRYDHAWRSHNGEPDHKQAISPQTIIDRVRSPFRVAVISDEITQDFDRACHIVAREFGMEWIELRSMWNTNMVNLDSKEIAEAQSILEKY